MKKYILASIVIIITLLICYKIINTLFFINSITKSTGMGNGNLYAFDCNNKELFVCIKNFYSQHKNYQVPEKWVKWDISDDPGYIDLMGVSYYFLPEKEYDQPEEMYYVTLIIKSLSDSTIKTSYLSIRKVVNLNNEGSISFANLSKKEKIRIEKRFKYYIVDAITTDSCNCKLKYPR